MKPLALVGGAPLQLGDLLLGLLQFSLVLASDPLALLTDLALSVGSQPVGFLAQLLLGSGDALTGRDGVLLDLGEAPLCCLQGLGFRLLLEGQLGVEGSQLGGEPSLGGVAGCLDLLARPGFRLAAVLVDLRPRPVLGAANVLAGRGGRLLGLPLLALQLLFERENLGGGGVLGFAPGGLGRIAFSLAGVLYVHVLGIDSREIAIAVGC